MKNLKDIKKFMRIFFLALPLLAPILIEAQNKVIYPIENSIYERHEAKKLKKLEAEAEKNEEIRNKKEQEQLDKDIKSIIDRIKDEEKKMFKSIDEASKYAEKKTDKILEIANKLDMGTVTTPDNQMYKNVEYRKIKDFKGEEYNQRGSVSYVATIDMYDYTVRDEDFPKNKEFFSDIDFKIDIDDLEEKLENNMEIEDEIIAYSRLMESFYVDTKYPKYTPNVDKNDKFIQFMYEYTKLSNNNLLYDTFVKDIDNVLQKVKEKAKIEKYNIIVSVDGVDTTITMYEDSNFEYDRYTNINEEANSKEFVVKFDSLSDYNVYVESIENNFEQWKTENNMDNIHLEVDKNKYEKLYKFSELNEKNKNDWQYIELNLEIGPKIDFRASDEPENSETRHIRNVHDLLRITIDDYNDKAELGYNFINDVLYDGKYKVSLEDFSKEAVSSAVKNAVFDWYHNVSYGIAPIGNISDSLMYYIDNMEFSIKLPVALNK